MTVHKVKNLKTGLVHTVNDGHYSLNSTDFQVIKEKVTKRKPRKAKPKAED